MYIQLDTKTVDVDRIRQNVSEEKINDQTQTVDRINVYINESSGTDLTLSSQLLALAENNNFAIYNDDDTLHLEIPTDYKVDNVLREMDYSGTEASQFTQVQFMKVLS